MLFRRTTWDEVDALKTTSVLLRKQGAAAFSALLTDECRKALKSGRPRLFIPFQNLHIVLLGGGDRVPRDIRQEVAARSSELMSKGVGGDPQLRPFSLLDTQQRHGGRRPWWTDPAVGAALTTGALDGRYVLSWTHVSGLLGAFARRSGYTLTPPPRPWPPSIEVEQGDLRITFPLEQHLQEMVGHGLGIDTPLSALQAAMTALQGDTKPRLPIVRSY